MSRHTNSIVLDMDSSESPSYGAQEGSATTGTLVPAITPNSPGIWGMSADIPSAERARNDRDLGDCPENGRSVGFSRVLKAGRAVLTKSANSTVPWDR